MDSLPSEHDRFLAILEAHQRLLLKVCWAYSRTSHDRDDLLQEIVSRLWGSFKTYDDRRKFSTWMYRVALNVAIDYRRRKRRWGRESVSLDEATETVLMTGPNNTDKQNQLAELHELLEGLEEADRVLLLFHLEGQSYSEIADILGISASNVGTRLNRLRMSLKQTAQEVSDNMRKD